MVYSFYFYYLIFLITSFIYIYFLILPLFLFPKPQIIKPLLHTPRIEATFAGLSYIGFGIRAKVLGLKKYMQLRSGATYASMSSQNTSNNQDAATICLEEILATQHSHQDAIIQLNRKLDEIMKLLEKS